MSKEEDPSRTIAEIRASFEAILASWIIESKAPPHVINAIKTLRLDDKMTGRSEGREEVHKLTHELLDKKMEAM